MPLVPSTRFPGEMQFVQGTTPAARAADRAANLSSMGIAPPASTAPAAPVPAASKPAPAQTAIVNQNGNQLTYNIDTGQVTAVQNAEAYFDVTSNTGFYKATGAPINPATEKDYNELRRLGLTVNLDQKTAAETDYYYKQVEAKEASDVKGLAESVAGEINAALGGREYIKIIQSGDTETIELNPGVTKTPGFATMFANAIKGEASVYGGAQVTKISDFEYLISPKAITEESDPAYFVSKGFQGNLPSAIVQEGGDTYLKFNIAEGGTSLLDLSTLSKAQQQGFAAAEKLGLYSAPTISAGGIVNTAMFSPSGTAVEAVETQTFSLGPQTMTTIANMNIQKANEIFQLAGIPRHIEQLALPEGEANALGYERNIIAMNREIQRMNEIFQIMGREGIPAPPQLQQLSMNPEDNLTGFAKFVHEADITIDNSFLGGIFQAGQEMPKRAFSEFTKPPTYLNSILGFSPAIGAAYLGKGGIESFSQFPELVAKLTIRSPVGGLLYAAKGGTSPLEDIGGFYSLTGGVLAGAAASSLISMGREARKGNAGAILYPAMEFGGGMFAWSMALYPKTEPPEVPPSVVKVTPAQAKEIQRTGQMPDLSEAQKSAIFEKIEASHEAARSARFQGMLVPPEMGDTTSADAWYSAFSKAPSKQWLYDKILGRLSKAGKLEPAYDFEPGAPPQIVETDEGAYAVNAVPAGGGLKQLQVLAVSPPPAESLGLSSFDMMFASGLTAGISQLGRGSFTHATAQPQLQLNQIRGLATQAQTQVQAQTLRQLQPQVQFRPQITTNSLVQPQVQVQLQLQAQAQLQPQVQTQPVIQPVLQVQPQIQPQIQVTTQITPRVVIVPPPTTMLFKPEKKRRPGSMRLPRLKAGGKSSIRSDLISSSMSKLRYGRATSPKPTPDIFKRFAVGGVIPTVEMRKAKEKPGLIRNLKNMFKGGRR